MLQRVPLPHVSAWPVIASAAVAAGSAPKPAANRPRRRRPRAHCHVVRTTAPPEGVALDYLAIDPRHRVWVPGGGTGTRRDRHEVPGVEDGRKVPDQGGRTERPEADRRSQLRDGR